VDVSNNVIRLMINILSIAPEYLWRDYRNLRKRGMDHREAFLESFWFHASGRHRRICGYVDLWP